MNLTRSSAIRRAGDRVVRLRREIAVGESKDGLKNQVAWKVS